MAARTRVFLATSLDGFLAGEDDDLSWLPAPDPDHGDGGFGAFLAEVGALLMGRRTWDVVTAFEGPWPYGTLPVLVATHRDLPPGHPTSRALEGPIADLVRQGLEAAGERDLYLDGGTLVRRALEAGLVDELIVTVVPIVLGRGLPLFTGLKERRALALKSHEALPGGLVQLTYVPSGRPGSVAAG
jgi:dihydrofolate reductase